MPRNGSKDKITLDDPLLQRKAGYSFKSAWEDDDEDELPPEPPKVYRCAVRVIGGKGIKRDGKLFTCFVKVRIPGGALATSTMKKEEDPFWDQSAVMEMPKKPNNVYVELMAHETKLLGAAKDVQIGCLKISLRKFIRGKETSLKLEFPDVEGYLLLQVWVGGFGRPWREGSNSNREPAHEMEDRTGEVALFRLIKTATALSVAKTEYDSTKFEIP